jgi:hypothetical protein
MYNRVIQTDSDLRQCVVNRTRDPQDANNILYTEAQGNSSVLSLNHYTSILTLSSHMYICIVPVRDGWIAEYIDIINTAPERQQRQPSGRSD